MADKGHEYDMYRESCVYVSAEIQGDLEKKKGVSRQISKIDCESLLYWSFLSFHRIQQQLILKKNFFKFSRNFCPR